MILAIDVGNTSTRVGLFRGRRLAQCVVLRTGSAGTPGELARRLRRTAGHLRTGGVAIVCSVVPRATPGVVRAIRQAGLRTVWVVGRDVRVPLRNRYRYPRQVGQDRLVGAYAAWLLYGDGARRGRHGGRNPERARRGESRDCIVVDFGTAITIDLVTRKGEYLGGAIAPGLELSLEALASQTALLPKVGLTAPSGVLGRDTASSIRAGIVYGAAALCDGLVGRLKRRYAPRATVVATGGSSRLLARYATSINHVNPTLVLDGLYALARQSGH